MVMFACLLLLIMLRLTLRRLSLDVFLRARSERRWFYNLQHFSMLSWMSFIPGGILPNDSLSSIQITSSVKSGVTKQRQQRVASHS
jgi:hypothetical protein